MSLWSACKCTQHAAVLTVVFGVFLRQMAFQQKQHSKADVIDLVDAVIELGTVLVPIVGSKHIDTFCAVKSSLSRLDGGRDGFGEFVALSMPCSFAEATKPVVLCDRGKSFQTQGSTAN